MNNINQLQEKVDLAVKQAWFNQICEDYLFDFCLKEDSLKSSFFHHIRNNLNDKYLINNSIRIYTEFDYESNKTADIGIVILDNNKGIETHIRDRVDNVLALIEMKFIRGNNHDQFYNDINKIMSVKSRKYNDTQFYLVFFNENYGDVGLLDENFTWLNNNHRNPIVQNQRLTELLAFTDEKNGKVCFSVNSRNKYNEELNKYKIDIYG